MTEKVVSFDELEDDKENYSYQRRGRSVSLISQLKSTSENSNKLNKNEYWERILQQVYLVDDPLPLFIEYIETESHNIMGDWTSKKSNLLEVNELCLLYCQRFDKYKNDPKYLNVWLDYCTNFFSMEDQIDIFYYMYRSNICTQLSDLYSYFVDIFILLKRYSEAYRIINLGIHAGAKPEKQLLDELNLLKDDENFDFLQMDGLTNHGSSSSSSSSTSQDSNLNSHLAFQINYNEPNLILNQERNNLIWEYQNRKERYNNEPNNTKEKQKEGNSKPNNLGIYRDDEFEADDGSKLNNIFNDGSVIPSLSDIESELKFQSRKEKFKENKHLIIGKIEPNSQLEPLKQVVSAALDQPRANNKLSIFNDNIRRNGPIYKIIHIEGKKPEKIDCNFNLIYYKAGIEYSIEEILALFRYGKTLNNNNKRDASDISSGENSLNKRVKS